MNDSLESSKKTVNSWVTTNIRPFAATTIFVVTWIDQTARSVQSDSKTFQLVIASDGYFSYAIFSYDNGVPTWVSDDNGMTPVRGFLAHRRRSDLCLKTDETIGKDFSVNNITAWNIYDELDCSNKKSFTECGDMKADDREVTLDSMSLQYSFTIHYKTTARRAYSAYKWQFYALVRNYFIIIFATVVDTSVYVF